MCTGETRVRATVNVCREAYPPVEHGADESVELSAHPTPYPLPSEPTPPTVTNPTPSVFELSLRLPSIPTNPLAPSLRPTPRATLRSLFETTLKKTQ